MKMPILVAIAATALALPASGAQMSHAACECSNGQVQVSNGGEHSPIEVHAVNSTP